jgi:hypothetical protein
MSIVFGDGMAGSCKGTQGLMRNNQLLSQQLVYLLQGRSLPARGLKLTLPGCRCSYHESLSTRHKRHLDWLFVSIVLLSNVGMLCLEEN